jgi:hypothetical protein
LDFRPIISGALGNALDDSVRRAAGMPKYARGAASRSSEHVTKSGGITKSDCVGNVIMWQARGYRRRAGEDLILRDVLYLFGSL